MDINTKQAVSKSTAMKQKNMQRVSGSHGTLCLTETDFNIHKRNIISKMNAMSPFPNSMCRYGFVYDYDKNEVIVTRIKDRQPGHPYFSSRDEAFSCLLAIGEANIRKYYFGVNREE